MSTVIHKKTFDWAGWITASRCLWRLWYRFAVGPLREPLPHGPSPAPPRLRRIRCRPHVALRLASLAQDVAFARGFEYAALANKKTQPDDCAFLHANGRGGIRTHGTVSRTPVFKTGSFGRSDTLPNCRNHLSTRTKPANDGPLASCHRATGL